MNKKIIYFIFGLIIISFLSIFLSSKTGYYEYQNNKKAVFTEEKIKEFEKDISDGKNVNIKDYITDESKDYSNKVTDIGNSVSNIINDSVNTVLKKSFNIIEKLIK